MSPTQIVAILREQHALIRGLIATCEHLVDALDRDQAVITDLARSVIRLRMTLEAHIVFEEAMLRTVLLDGNAVGPQEIERLVDDHVVEHRAMHEGLALVRQFPDGLRSVLAVLRDHLEDEERSFLSVRSRRDPAPATGMRGSATRR